MADLFTPRRLGALAGVAFVVLFVVGIPLDGSEPNLTATAAAVTSYYATHHSKVLIADLVISGSFIALLTWAAVLAGELRAAGRHAGAGVLLASITGAVTLALVSTALEIGLDQAAVRSADPGFVHGAYLVDDYLGAVIPSLLVAAAAAATALAGAGLFAARYRWLTGLVALLSIVGGISVKLSGFFSPKGGGTALSFVALLVWALTTSVILWARRNVTDAAPAHSHGAGQPASA
jgi:hypothetical protein